MVFFSYFREGNPVLNENVNSKGKLKLKIALFSLSFIKNMYLLNYCESILLFFYFI